jgi:tubulin-specific chaperone D
VLPRRSSLTQDQAQLRKSISDAVLRLCVEKLDKVRLIATRSAFGEGNLQSVSSYHHFYKILGLAFTNDNPGTAAVVFEGFVTSASAGASETIVQNSRAALVVTLEETYAGSLEKFLALCNVFVNVLRRNLENERLLPPLLDTFAFLFDMGTFSKLVDTDFK